MRKFLIPLVMALPLLSGGCIAKTIVDVATLPLKVAGQGVDWATTSQEEADRNYGKKMRKKEAQEGAEKKRAAQEEAMRDAELKEKQRNDRKRNRNDP